LLQYVGVIWQKWPVIVPQSQLNAYPLWEQAVLARIADREFLKLW